MSAVRGRVREDPQRISDEFCARLDGETLRGPELRFVFRSSLGPADGGILYDDGSAGLHGDLAVDVHGSFGLDGSGDLDILGRGDDELSALLDDDPSVDDHLDASLSWAWP